MFVKRMLTGLLGFPLVGLMLAFGTKEIITAVFSVVAIISIFEYFRAVKMESKTIIALGYISCLTINLLSFNVSISQIMQIGISAVFIILFSQVIITNMKTDFKDVTIALFGIIYVVGTIIYLPVLYGAENGKFLIWFVLSAAWGTDVFAYAFGKLFGKHTFSKISPKKSIEGCIGGIFGAICVGCLFAFVINTCFGMNYSYLTISLISILLSIISQIGDFTASSIKRCYDVKDFGTLFPGHGGMLDRIDSVIFIAPVAYFLLTLI